MCYSTPVLHALHCLLEFAHIHVHWVDGTIQPSHLLLPPSLQSFPAPGSLPLSQCYASGGQSIGASASIHPMNIQIQPFLTFLWTKGGIWIVLKVSTTTRWTWRTCTHLLLRALQNYNSLLSNHEQESVGSHQKEIPHIQWQSRNPSKMVGVVKSCLESNPIPARDVQLKQNLGHKRRSHRGWAKPAFECLHVSCVGVGQQWPTTGRRALGAADLGMP